MGKLLDKRECGARLAVVEDHSSAGRLCRDEINRRTKGFKSEVGNDAQPGEKGWVQLIEACRAELVGKRLPLEVDRDIREVLRSRQVTGFEQLALPLLGGGMIDLEDAKVRVGIAVSEGVEARTEENVLRDAPDGSGKVVFGVAAAGDEKGAE